MLLLLAAVMPVARRLQLLPVLGHIRHLSRHRYQTSGSVLATHHSEALEKEQYFEKLMHLMESAAVSSIKLVLSSEF